MNELITKISSYNIFNYLFPGVLFSAVVQYFGIATISSENVILDLFVYYFIGMTISRVGSNIIEPFFKRTKIVSYSEYSDYLSASKDDTKIDILIEQNNVYRTIVGLFTVLGLVVLGRLVSDYFSFSNFTQKLLIFLAVFALYVSAYRKQTSYIVQRIEKFKGQKDE